MSDFGSLPLFNGSPLILANIRIKYRRSHEASQVKLFIIEDFGSL